MNAEFKSVSVSNSDEKKSWRHTWHIDTDEMRDSLPFSASSLSLDISPETNPELEK